MSIDVDLQSASDAELLPSLADFQRWAEHALNNQRDSAELTIRVVDEAESQQLNRDYRGKDKPTNVLSFPFEAPPGIELNLLGDLVVCAPVVFHEAEQQHKLPHHHWAHMVIHGILHLLGYDHIDNEQAQAMESLETQLLAGLDIADPYQV
ncbi:MAG: rRNA maturation RNase YbeY [Halopseudomonas sp.]